MLKLKKNSRPKTRIAVKTGILGKLAPVFITFEFPEFIHQNKIIIKTRIITFPTRSNIYESKMFILDALISELHRYHLQKGLSLTYSKSTAIRERHFLITPGHIVIPCNPEKDDLDDKDYKRLSLTIAGIMLHRECDTLSKEIDPNDPSEQEFQVLESALSIARTATDQIDKIYTQLYSSQLKHKLR